MTDTAELVKLADYLAYSLKMNETIAHIPEMAEHRANIQRWHSLVTALAAQQDGATSAGNAQGQDGAWQPIETAPKTGFAFFLLDWADDVKPLNPPLAVSRWCDERIQYTRWQQWASIYKPLKWCPAPACVNSEIDGTHEQSLGRTEAEDQSS